MRSLVSSLLILIGAGTIAVRAAAQPSPAGCWLGQVSSGQDERRAILELERRPDGRWGGRFHRLGRAVDSDTLDAIAVEGTDIAFERRTVKGVLRFKGRLAAAGDSIRGTFVGEGETIPLAVHRVVGEDARGRALLGNWFGALERNGVPLLRIGLKFSAAPCGQITTVMDSPDQGAQNLPMTSLAVAGDSLHLLMGYVGGRYAAALSADGKRLTGTWTQAGATMDLNMARTDSIPAHRRPQEPAKPYPYIEEEVAYENPEQHVKIAGTLTLPRTGGPFPAVLLLSGSGAQNRDEAIMGHRPFLVIADHLTRRGIAVLRVDDRGIGGSTGDLFAATLADNAADALAGVRYLKSRREIDAAKIGLVGHSEGGWVAPIAATRSTDVAFIVLLAGAGVSGEELLCAQIATLSRAKGGSPEFIAANIDASKRLYAILKTEKADTTAQRRLKETLRQSEPELMSARRNSIDTVLASNWVQSIGEQLPLFTKPWFRYLLTYEPAPVLKRVRVPVLALYGSNDLQVPAEPNVQAVQRALRAGRNRDFTVLELPGLNHLFQNAPTGVIEEYAQVEETFAPSALELIGNWILERIRGKRASTGTEFERGQ